MPQNNVKFSEVLFRNNFYNYKKIMGKGTCSIVCKYSIKKNLKNNKLTHIAVKFPKKNKNINIKSDIEIIEHIRKHNKTFLFGNCLIKAHVSTTNKCKIIIMDCVDGSSDKINIKNSKLENKIYYNLFKISNKLLKNKLDVADFGLRNILYKKTKNDIKILFGDYGSLEIYNDNNFTYRSQNMIKKIISSYLKKRNRDKNQFLFNLFMEIRQNKNLYNSFNRIMKAFILYEIIFNIKILNHVFSYV
jgi:hypothetical protein